MTFPITMSELQDRGHADLADYVNYLVAPSPFFTMGENMLGVTVTFNIVDGVVPNPNGMLNDLINHGIDVRQMTPTMYRLIVGADTHRYGCVCSTCEPPAIYDREPLIDESAFHEEMRTA